MPGDILLHYGGNAPGGGDDHALLYLGKIKIKNGFLGFFSGEDHYVIDCTTKGGVGNVYMQSKSKNYYNECYVIKPDN